LSYKIHVLHLIDFHHLSPHDHQVGPEKNFAYAKHAQHPIYNLNDVPRYILRGPQTKHLCLTIVLWMGILGEIS
jgi:hypothetical protein